MHKRIAALVLALAVMACTGSWALAEESSPYPETFSIYCPLSDHIAKIGVNNYGELYVFQELEKRTGTHVEFSHPSAGADMVSQVNLMVASGSLPDVIVMGNWKGISGGLFQWYDDGVIYDLTEMIPEYMPNYYAILQSMPYGVQNVSVDGHMFYLTEFNHNVPFSGPIVREDWMKQLGIEEYPNTIDELMTYFELVQENDMNGNGDADDEWAISGYEPMSQNFSPYDLMWPWGITYDFMQIDGKVTHGMLEPEFTEAITFLHDLYARGMLDPDYETQDRDALDGKFMNNMVGFEYGLQPTKMNNSMAETSDFKATGTYNIRLTEDSPAYVFHNLYVSKITSSCDTVITTACDEPEKVLTWFDYIYSEEGSLLMNFGIEGESFEFDENGVPYYDYTNALAKHPDMTESDIAYLYRLQGLSAFPMQMSSDAFASTLHEYSKEGTDRWESDYDASRILPNISLTAEETEEVNDMLVDIETYVSTQLSRLVNGQVSLEEIPNIQQTLRDMGIERVIEIYQAAYDRFIA